MRTTLTVVLLLAIYVLLFVLERALPLRRPKARLLPRIVVNIAVSAAAFATAAIFVRPAAKATLELADERSLGLLPLTGLAGWPEIVVAFLLMDLTFYYWHIANHRVAFLWRFHNVHHIDPDLDVTTAFRFHFGEVGMSAAFRAAQLLLIGPSLAAFVIYEIAFQTHTLFHHSNLRLPLRLERLIGRVVITPRMHGIHHSNFRDETHSNFGVVFMWWDRLHRTQRLDIPHEEVTIGIPGYARSADNRVFHCFALPFLGQRDYWRSPEGVRIRRPTGRMERADRRLAA